jgi:transposase-like protein
LAVKKGKTKMTRKQDSAKVSRWREEFRKALSEDGDLLKRIVEETLQQVLEGEMEEALQAGKSERTETRLGYRAGYYNRTLITRVGKVELRVPQARQGRFRTEVFER